MKFKFLFFGIMYVNLILGQNNTLKFNVEQFNFGDVYDNKGHATYDFKYQNQSNDTLKIIKIPSSCGCSVPAWYNGQIAPNDTGIIRVFFNPAEREGPFDKSFTVMLSNKKYVVLRIKGKVILSAETKAIREKRKQDFLELTKNILEVVNVGAQTYLQYRQQLDMLGPNNVFPTSMSSSNTNGKCKTYQTCSNCKGTGTEPLTFVPGGYTCGVCNGKGKIEKIVPCPTTEQNNNNYKSSAIKGADTPGNTESVQIQSLSQWMANVYDKPYAMDKPYADIVYRLLEKAYYKKNYGVDYGSSPMITVQDCCIRDGNVAGAVQFAWACIVYASDTKNTFPHSMTPEQAAEKMKEQLDAADELCSDATPFVTPCDCKTLYLWPCNK